MCVAEEFRKETFPQPSWVTREGAGRHEGWGRGLWGRDGASKSCEHRTYRPLVLKVGAWNSSASSAAEPSEMPALGPHPDLLHQKLGVGPAVWVLTSPAGDSGTH